jgi:ribosomal protein L14
MAAKIVKSDKVVMITGCFETAPRELRVDNNHMKIISLAPEVL